MVHLLLILSLCFGAGFAHAQTVAADMRLLPGWPTADGRHIAGIEIRLPAGWKTYWRRPGEAGIPPVFDWSASRNVDRVVVHWPVPDVFRQGGLRSIGYHDGIVLPVEVVPTRPGGPVSLSLTAEFGICQDICVPVAATAGADLPAVGGTPDARISAALAHRPLSAAEAGARIGCDIDLTDSGAILTARITLPPLGGREDVVFEPSDPSVWISDPETWRDDDTLVSRARVEAPRGTPLLLDRSALVTTVLGQSGAVELHGCR